MPLPLQKLFTYKINQAESQFLEIGTRVAVPFGKSKLYTGIVQRIHNTEPQAYKAKDIHQILDDSPIVTTTQIKHWEWVADYYMAALGEVMRTALPSAFLLQSETKIIKNSKFTEVSILSDQEFIIYEALQFQEMLDISKISTILSKKTVLPIINSLLEKKAIRVQEVLYEKYTPKLVKYIRLKENIKDFELKELLESLGKAPRQREALLQYYQNLNHSKKQIQFSKFIKNNKLSASAVKALIDKKVFETYTLQEDRIKAGKSTLKIPKLSEAQAKAFSEINTAFSAHSVCLLHGVTGSGKTEIYIHLIEKVLKEGKQALFLVPEIALTTQLINRLEQYFGSQISVFHSRYSMNERIEVWQNILHNKAKARLIVGARSAVFLPFSNLDLILVDEAHETSYKQFDPAPRYQARDTAIVLAKLVGAQVLLGTATPSIETYHNAKENKYTLVNLSERYGNTLLPEVHLLNLSDAYRKKQMKGHFSLKMLELIQKALENDEQVILFQNRRGYSPVVECESCGVSPQCPNCDVSLTYHKYKNELRCHYCGFSSEMPQVCPACNNPTLNSKGFGTEQLEIEIKDLFPKAKVARMDHDTTRGKYSFHRIISSFQAREIDILVGTQMLSKGLDFSNVSLVGVMNADSMLNFPDFRAHERSFQMLVQVSGRAGRSEKRGKVLIQTYNPYHQILQQVTTNDYATMFKEQIEERWQYKYPPYYRIIRIILKHKNFNTVTTASDWVGQSMANYFGSYVLGPTSPAIGRIRNQYIKEIMLKIPPQQSILSTKKQVQKIKNHFQSIGQFRSVRFGIDVDSN